MQTLTLLLGELHLSVVGDGTIIRKAVQHAALEQVISPVSGVPKADSISG